MTTDKRIAEITQRAEYNGYFERSDRAVGDVKFLLSELARVAAERDEYFAAAVKQTVGFTDAICERDATREALRPFAGIADDYAKVKSEYEHPDSHRVSCTLGSCRRAARALKDPKVLK